MRCIDRNWIEFRRVIRDTIGESLDYTMNACVAIVGRSNLNRLANERNIDLEDLIIVSKATLGETI